MKNSRVKRNQLVLINICMQSYQTIKDIKLRDAWLKANGYSPNTFFNPDFQADYIRAKAVSKQLLKDSFDLLTQEQVELLQAFNGKSTKRHMYQVLNLYKKIRRQLHR
jgi:hypothetical protein